MTTRSLISSDKQPAGLRAGSSRALNLLYLVFLTVCRAEKRGTLSIANERLCHGPFKRLTLHWRRIVTEGSVKRVLNAQYIEDSRREIAHTSLADHGERTVTRVSPHTE